LVGARRRVELVLPPREPLGVLLPEGLRLLDDGSSPHDRLIAADGSALGPDSTLESVGVSDGAVLRLVRGEGSTSTSGEDICVDLRTWRRRPAEPVRVRLRRVGDVLESVGVIALLPLVIGVFGVYGRLLGTFA
jgi:hypothetical protein